MTHYWYRFLDSYISGVNGYSIAKKILLDQAVCPIFSFVFIQSTFIDKYSGQISSNKKKYLSNHQLILSTTFWLIFDDYQLVQILTKSILSYQTYIRVEFFCQYQLIFDKHHEIFDCFLEKLDIYNQISLINIFFDFVLKKLLHVSSS